MLDRRGRGAAVALHDGPVGLLPSLQNHDGFDSGSHRCGPTLIGATCDERVKLDQKLLVEPNGDLLRSHSQKYTYLGWIMVCTSSIVLRVSPSVPAMSQTISGAVASTHPVQFELDAPLKVARWRVIGNPIMAIPHFIYLALLGIVLAIFTLIAFFAILFTGAYPRGMFNFSTGVVRYQWRVVSFALFMREPYPSFSLPSGERDPGSDPATFSIPYPQKLSRGLPFAKSYLIYPNYIVLFFLLVGAYVVLVLAWFAVLFTGKWPEGMRKYVVNVMRWNFRISTYVLLMTDAYPPFSLSSNPRTWSEWQIHSA
jgi:hypothetical protein